MKGPTPTCGMPEFALTVLAVALIVGGLAFAWWVVTR